MGASDDNPIYVQCDICHGHKRCGPHRYDGRGVPQWGVWVCDSCRLTNDVPPVYEARVAAMLDAKRINYRRNKSGLIIIPQ